MKTAQSHSFSLLKHLKWKEKPKKKICVIELNVAEISKLHICVLYLRYDFFT